MIDDAALKTLFLDARTHRVWDATPVDDALLRRLYELVRMAPTSANTLPGRVLFVKSAAAKERLRPALDEGNVASVMSAPVTAVVAWDTAFFRKMNQLSPHRPGAAEKMGAMPEPQREAMATFSAALQAGYLILAARGLGLDCGPMGGFDAKKIDATFFPDGQWKSLVLVNLGHGDASKLRPRAPRLEFDEACRIE